MKLSSKFLAMLNRLPREGRSVKDPRLLFEGTNLEVTRINLHHARRLLPRSYRTKIREDSLSHFQTLEGYIHLP